MKLATKTLFFVGLTFLFLFGVFYFYSRELVLRRFEGSTFWFTLTLSGAAAVSSSSKVEVEIRTA